jgi:acyl transferase domain-containing protein/thioesterase domain-containing protein
MGDPIEVAALTQAFREDTNAIGFCGIGSVKTNIGHLDTAAGVASLVKATLALHHREFPPSINFERNNPLIDFETSPFFVQSTLEPWQVRPGVARRAGVNSLGVGGTNAFAVVEEYLPKATYVPSQRPLQLLTLSARNRTALDTNSANLARYLREQPDVDLGDVAWTLQVGRRSFSERRVLVARNRDEAIALLESLEPRRVFTHSISGIEQSIAFLFPGGGAQYARMAADLYASEPTFAAHIDAGLERLQRCHQVDLRPLLLCEVGDAIQAGAQLALPSLQLPAIFLVEYALAQLLIGWGIQPTALLGHSVGENTAACVAGTMTFNDCLGLVVLRGRLMDRVAGGMAAVSMSPGELQPLLDELGLDLAAINAPDMCVASGSAAGIASLQQRLGARGIEAHRVKIDIAAHSRLLDPVLAEFRTYLESIQLSAPSLPWVSNRTGTWITNEEAISPEYWVQHLRGTVRFADCLATLAEDAGRVFLEVGPGKTLSSLAKGQPCIKTGQVAIPTMRHPEEQVSDDAFLLTAIGRLWAAGGPLDTGRLFNGEQRRRVGIPTYAFQGQRYFIDPGAGRAPVESAAGLLVEKEADEEQWFWEPVWKQREAEDASDGAVSWLLFEDDSGIGAGFAERMRRRGDQVVRVRAGDSYQRISDDEYVIAAEHGRIGYDSLVRDLVRTGRVPDRVAHLPLLSDPLSVRPGSSAFHRNQEQGFYSLLFFAQAWAADGVRHPLHIVVATTGMQKVHSGDPVSWPEQATVLGPVKVIPREVPDVTVSCVDVELSELSPSGNTWRGLGGWVKLGRGHSAGPAEDQLPPGLALLDAELRAPPENAIVAHRRGSRYVQAIRRKRLTAEGELPLRQHGVVIVTGGLGGIGLTIGKELAATSRARIVLLSRTPLPARSDWLELTQKLGTENQLSRAIAEIGEIEALGGEVLVLGGDVTNIESMRAVAQEVRQRFGAINGVVHAAGVVRDDLLATKSQSDVEEVLAPKVYGTLVLEEVLRDDDLDVFVAFSSTSTATAPIGQVDYVAANAFLNAFAQARAGRARCKVLSLNWGVWNEIGMAARAAARMLGKGAADATVANHPFFDRLSRDEKGVVTLEARWSPAQHWFLDEHRTAAGDALLPGAAYLELASAALTELGLLRPFEINDLMFFRPLSADDSGRDVRVRLSPTSEGYSLDVAMRVELDPGFAAGATGPALGGWRRVAQAELILREQTALPGIDLDAMEKQSSRRLPTTTKQQNHLRFGPRWSVVERVTTGGNRAIASLRLADEFVGDLDKFGLHPSLVDLATGFAMDLIDGYTGDALWVPVSYDSIRIQSRRLPPRIRAIASVRDGSSEAGKFARFDVTITDEDGRVLVAAENFTIKRLEGAFELGLGVLTEATDVELDHAPAADRALSQSELAFQHNLTHGIRPDEGRRVFARALRRYDGPQLYVSSMDLSALVAQADATAMLQRQPAAPSSGTTFARPQLDSNYIEPRDPVEATLVEMWCDLLGVGQIGVQDNFFELGGHSLIAVRLFAKVRRAFSVEFPISVLFEAPTIEACAALIRAHMPTEDAAEAETSMPASRPRYTHLVPMHPGEGGPDTPFFLVAGMFGNVLNLRHLAHQIGSDRPFYGIQARGLYGGDQPHETFDEMARDYLAEARLVQPHGPYMLGGFSGGGIAALEMARQLMSEGEEVALLVMLDTPLPHPDVITRRDKVVMHLQNLRRTGASYPMEVVRNRITWRKRLRQEALGAAAAEGELHSRAIGAAFYRALDRYEVRPYDGTITLFRPKLKPTHILGPGRQIDAKRDFVYEDNGWGPWCRRVDVTEVPGDHDSMVLEPNVRVLAARMRSAIERVTHALHQRTSARDRTPDAIDPDDRSGASRRLSGAGVHVLARSGAPRRVNARKEVALSEEAVNRR